MSYTFTVSSTVLGPLTTIFTPPPACTVAVAACSTCDSGWQAQTCDSVSRMGDDRSCWPSRSAGAYERPLPLMGWGIYSPGLVCPSGYSTACSWDGAKETGDFEFLFKPDASETAIGCCPTGYGCSLPAGLIGQTCVGLITTNSIPTVTCASGTSDAFKYQTVPYAIFQTNATIIVSTFTVLAPLIQLNYQDSDVRGTTADATKATLDVSSPSLLSSTTSTPSTSNQQQGGLSAGAAAGIGIGAALLTIALVTGIICLVRAHKRKKDGQINRLNPNAPGCAAAATHNQGIPYQSYYEFDANENKMQSDMNNHNWYTQTQLYEVATPPAELGDYTHIQRP